MGASITLAGESLIAQKQATKQTLEMARFVLANIPGLDTTKAVDRGAGLPAADQIVYTEAVQHVGYLASNKVVYSLMLGTDLGDFDFNWIGLETVEGTLFIAAYVPLQQKRREIPPSQTGNNLTRNIVWEYDGAQVLSGIDVPASTWQFDFSSTFSQINTQLAQLKSEIDSKVDAADFKPLQNINLDGPVLVYPGSTNTYKITDFNRFSVFAATASAGTVTVSGDTITLVMASNAAAGVVDLLVKRDDAEQAFQVAVGAATIVAPTITSPANLATGTALDLSLKCSAYQVFPAGFDAHKSTRWQVAIDAAFTQLVFDKTSTTELLEIRPADYDVLMAPGKRHYVRAYHNGASLQSGAGPASSFNTATIYIRTPAMVFPVDGQVNVSPYSAISSDAFSVYGGGDVHIASRWQYSTQASFATILIDSGWVTAQLTSYAPANVPQNTTLYSRVKYRGQTLGESEWSAGVQYTTADQLKGTFTAMTAGGLERYYHSGVAIDKKVLIQGGIPGATPVARSDTWEYDTVLGSWAQRASYYQSYCHSAVVYGGKMYLFGGSNDSAYYATLRLFNPSANAWSDVVSSGTIPSARSQHFAVVLGTKMYLGGGSDNRQGFNDFFVFDFLTSKWSTLASLPTTVTGSAVTYNGLIYAFGSTGVVYVYDPAANKWSTKKSGAKRSFSPAALVGTKVYFFGGTDGTVAATSELWFYDILSDNWLKVGSGANIRSGHSLVAVDGKLYMYAGHYNGYAKTDLWRID